MVDLWPQKFALSSAIALRPLSGVVHFALLCAVVASEVIEKTRHSSLPDDARAWQLATKLRRDAESLLIAKVLPQAVPRWLRTTNMPPPGA